jgi:aryl-alcohol dehydrogenase-like predicted oxidoreductase
MTTSMRYRQLGRTGLYVSEICLGTMTFGTGGNGQFWDAVAKVDQAHADEMVRTAIAAGVNVFDTADVYSFGQSETILGQALANAGVRRSDIVLCTKVFARTGAGPNDCGASRVHIMAAIQHSLKRLNTDYIDIYMIHGTDVVTPVDETLRTLDDLVSSGMVRYIGLSNWHAWRIAKALGISDRRGFARFEVVQAYYSLVGRDIEHEIVDLLREESLGLMVWSPLAGGLLSGKYNPAAAPSGGRRSWFDFPPTDRDVAERCLAAVHEVAKKYDRSPGQVALAWLLEKGVVTSIVAGANNVQQLEQNIAAINVELDSEDVNLLDRVGAIPLIYPGWMLERHKTMRMM